MKRATILIWILSGLLAANDLRFLPGHGHPADFWFFASLCCYSFPFLILVMIRIPSDPSLERYVILTPFILVFLVSILFPILSDTHATFLPGLGYLFIAVFEGGLIAAFLVAFVIIRLL